MQNRKNRNQSKKIKVAKSSFVFKRTWDSSLCIVPNLQTLHFLGNTPALMREPRTRIAIKSFMELIQTTIKWSVDLQNHEKQLLCIFEISVPCWHQNVNQKLKSLSLDYFCWNFAQLKAKAQSISECKTQMSSSIINHSSSSIEELLGKNQEEFFCFVLFFQEGNISYKKKVYIFARLQISNETGVWLKVMWNENVHLDNAVLMSVVTAEGRGHFYGLAFLFLFSFFATLLLEGVTAERGHSRLKYGQEISHVRSGRKICWNVKT